MFPITPNTDTVDTVERVETHTYKSNIAYAVDIKKLKLVNVSESFNTFWQRQVGWMLLWLSVFSSDEDSHYLQENVPVEL